MARIMGLDVGDKTIGVALSDPLFVTAQPFETIRRTKAKADIDRIEKIVKEKDINQIVVGLPKNMNNTMGPQSMKVISFVDLLKKRFEIEILYEDERLTTVQSEGVLIDMNVRRENRKKQIDNIAASFILQSFLDRRSNG